MIIAGNQGARQEGELKAACGMHRSKKKAGPEQDPHKEEKDNLSFHRPHGPAGGVARGYPIRSPRLGRHPDPSHDR